MAIYYCRSTDGDNADTGATWALAKADLHTATTGALATASGAGDTIYVSDNHAQSTAASITLTALGTAGNPTKIVAVDDGAEPPTTLSTVATVTTTGASNITFTGFGYWYGITFSAGTLTNTGLIIFGDSAPSSLVFENCKFVVGNTNGSSDPRIGAAVATTQDDCRLVWLGCGWKFGATTQTLELRHGSLVWSGGAFDGTGSVPTSLFTPSAGSNVNALVENVDLSAFTGTLVAQNVAATGRVVFRNCKLHASVTTAGNNANGPGGVEVWLDNCDSGDTNYRMERFTPYLGTVKQNTTVKKAASDGTTTLSWLMEPTANVTYTQPLYSPEMVVWNDTAGSAKTITVEVLQDAGTALHIDDAWLEVDYLGTSGFPIATRVKDDAAAAIDIVDVITGASTTALTTGAGTGAWTGEGGSAVSYKLVATVTPQEKGLIRCRVALAADVDLYVDPVITVT